MALYRKGQSKLFFSLLWSIRGGDNTNTKDANKLNKLVSEPGQSGGGCEGDDEEVAGRYPGEPPLIPSMMC